MSDPTMTYDQARAAAKDWMLGARMTADYRWCWDAYDQMLRDIADMEHEGEPIPVRWFDL